MRLFKLTTMVTLLLALVACTQGGLINSFTAQDTTVTPGAEVRLEWRTGNHDTLTLNPAIGDVSGRRSIIVTPTQTTAYELEARQGGRSEVETLTVEVGNAPVINDFEVSPESVSVGTPTTLVWNVAGAESVTISPVVGSQPARGSAEVTQQGNGTYTYTLVAENQFGTATREVVLRVGEGPTISSFTASPDRLDEAGGDVELRWNVSGEGTVRLTLDDARDDINSGADERNVTSTNTFTVRNLEQSLVFTLTAANDQGTTTRDVTVVVGDRVPPQVTRFDATPSTIDAGESTTLSWTVTGDSPVTVTLRGDDGFSDTFTGSGSASVDPDSTTTYTLTARNENGRAEKSVRVTVQATPPPSGDTITLLLAGQSNASSRAKLVSVEPPSPQVRMLGNDYVWKQATEPTDSNQNQVDTVSRDNGSGFTFGAGHSFGVTLGKELNGVTGEQVYLIPASKGGSCVRPGMDDCNGDGSWAPPGNKSDRSTLFGSANYRAQLSAGEANNPPASAEGGPVTGIVWYQGESDQSNSNFIRDTNAVMNTFMTQLDRPGDDINGVPVVYVQLAQRLETEFKNEAYQSVREGQRQMETGYGASARDNYYMVVAHDLPMDDKRHLGTEGQKILGERIALAYQEHVLGRDVDGTGPRLVNIRREGRTIRVKTTQTINDSSTYADYFTVFVSGSDDKTLSNGGISEIRRDPSDNTTVRITLDEEPADGVSVSIRYRPPTAKPSAYPTSQLNNVVKSQSSGLPLPAFGGLTVP